MRDEGSSLASALLDWLRQRAVNGRVCEPIRAMAAGLDVSEESVRRALAELARSHRATPGDKAEHGVRAWLIPTPQGAAAAAADEPSGEGLRPIPTTDSSDHGRGQTGWAAPADAVRPAAAESGSMESAQGEPEPVAPHDDAEAFVVSRVQRYIEQVGFHLDREAEVEEQVFGERGLVWQLTKAEDKRRLRASLLADQGYRARTLALWRGHRKTGERMEREELERAGQWRESRARMQEREAAAAPAAVLAADLTEQALTSLQAETPKRRNGSAAPDPDWPDLDWTPPDF